MKKLLVVLLIIAAVGTGLYLYFHKKHQPVVNDEIAKRLIQLVSDGSNGLYRLELDSLEANVVDSKLTLFKARLIPDTLVYAQMLAARTAPQDLFEVSVDQFTLDDISPVDFLTVKEINLEKLMIKNPVILVKHSRLSYKIEKNDSTKTVFQRLENKVSHVRIDTIFVQNAVVTYDNTTKKKVSHIEKVSFLADNFLLDETTQNDTTRFLFAKNFRIHVLDYTLHTSDSLYKIKLDDISIQTATRQLAITNLSFTPKLGVKEFYRQIRHQQDRFNMTVKTITIHDIEWWSMIGDEALTVQKINLDDVQLNIFNDKSMPVDRRSKIGKYPHQLLSKMAFGLKIDTIAVKNMNLTYTELNPKTGETGSPAFSGINARIYNITNDSATIARMPLLKIDATARFMKEASVKAVFIFDLKNYKRGNFEVQASLGKVSAEALSRLTMPLGLVKIETLDLRSLQANIKGDNLQAKGTIKLEYQNLKIAVLKNKEDTVKKRKLLSFIANSFVLKSSNPSNGKPLRVAQASFTRDPNKSFFNLVWKTVFTGAKQSVGYK